jgi:nucleotide-binding universal stress UspA family protein
LIVCPIEFAPSSEIALGEALSLARWYDAELHIVHVRPGGRPSPESDAHDGGPLHERLRTFVENLNPIGVTVTSTVLTGDLVTAVVEYAQGKAANLVVVPQHGRRGSSQWRGGGWATAISRGVECLTIAVPDCAVRPTDDETRAPFRNILCAVDFTRASMRALHEALNIAQQSAGRITLLHVLGFPNETVHSSGRALRLIDEYRVRVEEVNLQLRQLVPPDAWHWCHVETVTVSGVPHDAIAATARGHQCDLIVMGLPRRPLLEQLVMRSTVRTLLRQAPCPVLMAPGPAGMAARVVHPLLDAVGEHHAHAPVVVESRELVSNSDRSGGGSWS